MDLKRLRTFVTVAEDGSVSKAATRLHITQPALTRQLQDLQRELGIQLFDRIGRGLVLTSVAEQMLADCRAVLNQADALKERAERVGQGDAGVLKVAASPVQIEAVLAPFLHHFSERYPRVQVQLVEAVGPDILRMLERGAIHLGILLDSIHTHEHNLETHPVPPVALRAVCHPSFTIKSRAVELRRLVTYPLLLLDGGFVIRKTFDAACRMAGLRPNILIESRAPSNLLALAEAHYGVAVLPSVVLVHRYALRSLRITHEGKPLQEPVGVTWDKRRTLPQYAIDFAKLLAAHMRGNAHFRRRTY